MKGNIEIGYNIGHGQAQLTTKERKFSESSSSMLIANHRKNVCNILCSCGKKAIFLKFKTNKNYGIWFYRCGEWKNEEMCCGFFEWEDE